MTLQRPEPLQLPQSGQKMLTQSWKIEAPLKGIASAGVHNGLQRFHYLPGFYEAVILVNQTGVTFRASAKIEADILPRFDRDPGALTIKNAISEAGLDAYEFDVIYFLSRHVLTEWDEIRRAPAVEHRALYDKIQKAAAKLARLLEDTGSSYHRNGSHGMQKLRVAELFSEQEEVALIDPLRTSETIHGLIFTDDPVRLFPTIEDLLPRLAAVAKRIEEQGPPHTQPNKDGARSGYFVRHISDLLHQRYKTVSREIVAAVATLALGEAMTTDLVTKLCK